MRSLGDWSDSRRATYEIIRFLISQLVPGMAGVQYNVQYSSFNFALESRLSAIAPMSKTLKSKILYYS